MLPLDTQTPQTPGWWLHRLIGRLGDRQAPYNRHLRYYLGDADLPEGAHQARQAYQRLIRLARVNFGELVVEATRERMMVTGFRTGDDASDDLAWRIWQNNSLDADQALIDRPTLSMGDSYVIVGPTDPEIGVPVITAEDPRQVITEHDPTRRRKVVAALKVFRDSTTGNDTAFIYLPGMVYRAERPVASAQTPLAYTSDGWLLSSKAVRLPIQQVPVVRYSYRIGDMNRPGRSELDGSIDTLDRINHMLLQRVVIATTQAYRQRAVRGDLPVTDKDGQEIDYSDIFAPDPGAMWQLPENVEIWESQQVDLTPVLTSVRHDVQDLAATTRTPLFYLTPDAANGSAEGASLAREGLIHKVLDRIAQAGESHEQTQRLAFAMMGRPLSTIETVWQPPERFSLAERYDAATKAAAAGVPWESVMGDVLQHTPTEVTRLRGMRAAEAFLTPDAAPA